MTEAQVAVRAAQERLDKAREQRPEVSGLSAALVGLLQDDAFSWRVARALEIGETHE